ncbi:hypothetical protein [[Mycobacterium] burgundiense]|uniref:Exported repetitive protein Erp n=1 Tax=[Mycobacterium] burgundiense TaxID=3064286 RepID=A0ABN9MZA7_9MYCO|nr:hypothetical protein [Mycolicibacterium sp. MU0053]CAJ1494662.1 hypothetical protein MU0053_000117 [Mycolicibacterium sp. MU0053]
MPNRRRRKLSTAMSAVAALAVASPFAVIALSELSPAPQERDFQQAAVVTDLPNELMSALQQGLSQFGINLPPMPTGLSPAGAMPSTGLTSPALTNPGLGLGTPGLTAPGLTTPGLTSPGLTTPGLTTPATPGLTTPALGDPALANPALTPELTSPAATVPGLTDVSLNPSLTSPDPLAAVPGAAPGLGLPNEMPISAPIGLDPMAGTYPILGDPSLSAMPVASSGGGGLISDLSSAAQQLGAGQAIDLLKGVVMPSIMSAVQSAAPAAQGAAAPAAEAAAGAAAGAAEAIPAAAG